MNQASIEYAVQNTRLLYMPSQRIDSFGDTRFNFRLITESMDEVGACIVRSGWVETRRPRILRPAALREIAIEGFGEDAQRFFNWIKEGGISLQALINYAFCFERSEVQSHTLHENVEQVCDKIVAEALESGDSLRAVLSGVEDAWEVSLLCLSMEMIKQSHEINIFDMRRRGLL